MKSTRRERWKRYLMGSMGNGGSKQVKGRIWMGLCKLNWTPLSCRVVTLSLSHPCHHIDINRARMMGNGADDGAPSTGWGDSNQVGWGSVNRLGPCKPNGAPSSSLPSRCLTYTKDDGWGSVIRMGLRQPNGGLRPSKVMPIATGAWR